MAGESAVDQIQFGPFCLDVNGSPVFRDGADLKLRTQAVRVLKALLGRPGQSIDYEPLLKQAGAPPSYCATHRRDDRQQDVEDTRRIRFLDRLSAARRLFGKYLSLR